MLTFHKIVAGCERGEPGAWRAFLSDYSPLVIQLTRVYVPGGQDAAEAWREPLQALCREDFKLLRSFQHQSELEFLIDLRSYFLGQLRPEQGTAAVRDLSLERVTALLKDLPLLHQEVAFLKLAGYSDRTLEQVFRITPAVAQKSLERLQNDYAAALGREQDACPWPGAWLDFLRSARSAKTETCPPLRLFVRIQDGQIGWYEKDPAEKHVAQCLHCLETWTGLREIGYWRNAAPTVPPEMLESLLSFIPLRRDEARSVPFFKRMFR